MFTLILLSASWTTPILAQEPPKEKPPEEQPPEEPPRFEDRQFNGTFISWNKEESTMTEQWAWQNQAWEFGPYPTFAIFLLNGTKVTDINCVPLGELFKVVIDVKKTIFIGNMTLGRAGLNWHTDLQAKNGS